MVSSDGDVSGCLTDVDIRRALINGLNEAVDTIAQMNPVTVTVDEPADLLEKFRSFKIDVLIQVDEQKPTGVPTYAQNIYKNYFFITTTYGFRRNKLYKKSVYRKLHSAHWV